MAYELSSSVKYVKPILGFYTEGPWTSLVEANANIDPAIRVQGMACKIIIAGVAHIYWYRDGVLDADLVEFMGGSSFDPENITTNLVFNPSFDRNINRIRVDGLTTYLQEIILSDIGTILTNVQIDPSGFRRARLEANAIGGFTLSYTSPEGNNQVVILPDKTELSKVGRYISPPAILHDLDIPHKKYVDDLSNSKQDRLAGIVSGCEITVETFSGTPVATNKQIKVSKGLALTNSWYIPTSEYSKLADTISSEITLCPTGGDFKYYDIVADNTNAITIHEGTPSTAPAHYVIDPLTEVLLGFITVGDAVIEEPVVTPSSRIYSNFFPELITTTNQSLSVQTIQGLDRLNALFLNQTDPLDNGFYGWNGAVWVKFSFPMGFWDTETDFLYNTLFIAQEGDYANQAFVFNNYIGNRSSRNISGGGLTQASQAQVEAAFDNTDQTTPVVLEQTSALTPFNAWWLVQKIKTWVKAGFTLTVTSQSATGLTIECSTGTDVTLPSATTILAGLQSAADKTKLDKYPATATNNKYLKGNGTSWEEVDSPVTQTITDGVTATAPSENAVFDKFASLTTAVIPDSTDRRYVLDYFINNFPVMKVSYYTYTTGAKTFTLSNTPISDLLVMVNGVSLRKTTDWTISGAAVTIPEVVYLDEVSIMFQYAYSFVPVFMYGLDYSTANSYSSIAHSAAIAFNKDSAFTLAIHFAIRTHAVNFLFAKETGTSPFDGYFLRINSNGTIYFSFAALSPSAQGDYFIPSEVLSLNTIYSIVVTKNTSYGTSSAYKIFLNGVELVKTTAVYTLTGSAVTSNTNPLLTGAGRLFTSPQYYSEIVTFDQAVFSKELTPMEAQLYHNDKGDDIEATIGSVLVHHRHNDQTLPIPDRSGNSRIGIVTALTASQFVSPSSFS